MNVSINQAYLINEVEKFRAGSISKASVAWKELTNDANLLDTVNGLIIQFESECPPATNLYAGDNFSSNEHEFIKAEIYRLLNKGMIKISSHEKGEFISPIFLTQKSDGGYRLILNLKQLNKYIPYVHFKMDTVEKVLTLVTNGCYFAKIDIKDAYYSVKINELSQKYLKFIYKGKLYQFTCLPNGLCSGPRKFTKLLKPALSNLRKSGAIVSGYIDDIITIGHTFKECQKNINMMVPLFQKLGFVVHPSKSCFEPSQKIEYLGFIINSIDMTIRLTPKRTDKIVLFSNALLKHISVSIREIARFLGYLSSSFIAVRYGKLHYRDLERCKILALKLSKGNFEKKVNLNEHAIDDIKWWAEHVQDSLIIYILKTQVLY